MRIIKLHFLALLSLLLLATSIYGQVIIKIGSIAPARSPWDNAIKKMGRDWTEISGGKVKIKVYAGGIVGSEKDMIRKMRMGNLGGAALTNMGITHIYPDAYVFNTPLLISSEKEFNYVFEKMKPRFEKEIEEKGFKVIIWTLTGWINFFTKNPVIYPEDMKKHKISFTTGMPKMEQAWKKAGYQIVPGDLKDLMMSLQSGMVDAFYLPPLVAGSGQYFAQAPNMCPIKVCPLIGGIVLSQKTWAKIPDEYKEQMMAAARKVSEELYGEIVDLEAEALTKMKKHGLIINEVPADALGKWRTAVASGMDTLVGNAFSEEIYNQLKTYLKEYREKETKKETK